MFFSDGCYKKKHVVHVRTDDCHFCVLISQIAIVDIRALEVFNRNFEQCKRSPREKKLNFYFFSQSPLRLLLFSLENIYGVSDGSEYILC